MKLRWDVYDRGHRLTKKNAIALRLPYRNSKNLQPLDILACNSAKKQSFQNLTKNWIASSNVQRLQNLAILASFLWGNLTRWCIAKKVYLIFITEEGGIKWYKMLSHKTVHNHSRALTKDLGQISMNNQSYEVVKYEKPYWTFGYLFSFP